MTKGFVRALKLIFAIGFVAAAVAIAVQTWATHETKQLQIELVTVHNRTVEDRLRIEEDGTVTVLEELPPDPLKERNPDYLGWLTVFGTQVNLPVVLGEDNTYYLSYNFDREWSYSGCPFADSGTDPSSDGNLLIYGHHMNNGTMFQSLDRFIDRKFFEDNELLLWQSQGKAWMYRIFAVVVIPGYSSSADYLPLQEYINELPPEKTEELIDTLEERASFWRDIELTDHDKFIFLVTCNYSRADGRLLLCAKRIEARTVPGKAA